MHLIRNSYAKKGGLVLLLKINHKTRYDNQEKYPDEVLIIKIRKENDQEAYEEIYKRYQKIIEYKSRKYWTSSGDDNDMQQEGFIGLMNAIRDYRHDKNISFKKFADLCITRQMITALKTSKRQKHEPLNGYISLNKPYKASDNSEKILLNVIEDVTAENPEVILVSSETSGLIMSKLNKVLSPLEKRVLAGMLENKKYIEISEDINKDIKSVDNAVQRIRKKLKIIIDDLREKDLI